MEYKSIEDLPFKEVIAIDFEFCGDDGDLKVPVCLVASDLRTGKISYYWRDELLSMRSPPFDVGEDCLIVSYYASAEFSMFRVLKWEIPIHNFDLFTEFRCMTNGQILQNGNSLIGALSYFDLLKFEPHKKDLMRDLIQTGGPWSPAQQANILDYCAEDVRALPPLLSTMLNKEPLTYEQLGQALFRGRYMAAVSAMEYTGIPIDLPLLKELKTHWSDIKRQLIETGDKGYGVYEAEVFKINLFEGYLRRNEIAWPRLESGRLDLKTDTFKNISKSEPTIYPLYQLKRTISELNMNNLSVGQDARNRCILSPFRSKTGRNQPSTTKLIFGPAKWLRGLIKPKKGHSIAYCDWASQEIAIAAALSDDKNLWEAYNSGDPYIAFAIRAGLAPGGATKASHPDARNQCKQVVLGTLYGMTAHGISEKAKILKIKAAELLQRHREVYRVFWSWADGNMNQGLLGEELLTCFGWKIRVDSGDTPKANTFLNWPMQAHGAEMMRLACCLATEGGLKICAPIHDALLLEAPTELIDEHLTRLKNYMNEASEIILGENKICRVDHEVFHYPSRYMDEKGEAMWTQVMKILDGMKA